MSDVWDIVAHEAIPKHPDNPCDNHCMIDQRGVCIRCKMTIDETKEWEDASLNRKNEIIERIGNL